MAVCSDLYYKRIIHEKIASGSHYWK